MPFQQVTAADLQQEMADRLDGSPFWTPDEALLALNEALRVWNVLTGQWKARGLVPVPASSPFVALPASLTWTARVEWEGRLVDLTSLTDLDNGRPGWQAETTASGGVVPTRPRLWAPAGLRMLALWPAPSTAAPSSLTVDGMVATPILRSTDSFLDLGREEHEAIVKYALHTCAFKEAGGRFAGTQAMRQEFYQAALDRNSRLLAATLFRGMIGLDVNRSQRPDRRATAPAASS